MLEGLEPAHTTAQQVASHTPGRAIVAFLQIHEAVHSYGKQTIKCRMQGRQVRLKVTTQSLNCSSPRPLQHTTETGEAHLHGVSQQGGSNQLPTSP